MAKKATPNSQLVLPYDAIATPTTALRAPTHFTEASVEVWHQLPTESAKAFHAFQHALHLPPWLRSSARAYTRHLVDCRGYPARSSLRQPAPEWKRWRRKFAWADRVRQFDAAVHAHVNRDYAEAAAIMNRHHARTATGMPERLVPHSLAQQLREAMLAPDRAMSVYFIRADAMIKIGISCEPMARIRHLQIGNPVRLELMGVMPGGREKELELHEQFHHLWLTGEWFTAGADLVQYIAAHAMALIDR